MTYFPAIELDGSIVGAVSFHFSVRDGKRWVQNAPKITKATLVYMKKGEMSKDFIGTQQAFLWRP